MCKIVDVDKKEIIETERLRLRALKEEDAEAIYFGWASDDEVTKYLTWPTHQSIEDTKAILSLWLKEYDDPKTIRFGIEEKTSGKLIGAIDVVDYEEDIPEIGYLLSRPHWGKGYMTEACSAFIAYLWKLGFKSIHIAAMEENQGSNRVIAKCGFRLLRKEQRQQSQWKKNIVIINEYILEKE